MLLDALRRFGGRVARAIGDRPVALARVLVPASTGSPITKTALLAATICGVAASGAVAIAALGLLLLALTAIYWLLTRVLGLELGIDPEAFFAHLQQQARQAAPR